MRATVMNAIRYIVVISAFVVGPRPALAATFADYRDDFAGTTVPPRWAYQWNAGGTLGDTNGYSNLVWSESMAMWNGDGGDPFPRPTGEYVNFRSEGGHPGPGTGQGAAADRFAIAGYTLPVSGPVYVTGSLFRVESSSGFDDLKVMVNSTTVRSLEQIKGDTNWNTSFDGWIGDWNAGDTVYVAVGPRGDHSYDGFVLDFSLSDRPQRAPRAAVDGASFTNQFLTVTPPRGWSYLWNSDGPIGNPRNYSPLQWNGAIYERDTDPDFPDIGPADYVYMSGNGTHGHPGRGVNDGAAYNVYCIVGLCVPTEGKYVLTNAWIQNISVGTIDLLVHVNTNAPLITMGNLSSNPVPHAFNVDLGYLNAGDHVYAAVGPNNHEYGNSFAWDFTILRRGGYGTLILIK